MSKYVIPSLLLLSFSSASLLQANPQERAAKIAPYVDEQTIAVLYVDFDRIAVPDTFKQVAELVPSQSIRNKINANATSARGMITSMKEAGAELFVVFSSSDLPAPGPFLIVSTKQGADSEKLLAAFKEQKPEACEQVNKVIYSGSAAAFERIKSGTSAARPHLARAFAAAGDAPVQLLVAPAADHRRVIKEMLPKLPEALGGGSSSAIADLEWVAASVKFSPELQVSISTQSPNDDSALALKSTVGSLFFSLARNESVRKSVPNIEKLLSAIVPRSEGKQLKLSVSAADGNVKQLLAALSTPVWQAQASGDRQNCVTNLKHLALGMHNYHGAHKSFPSAASRNADGEPLLSWRVHLLPYLEHQKLYDQFRLSEPWDSEHNKQLISQMPEVFACPSSDLRAAGKTTYLVPTGPNAAFKVSEGARLRDITDGTSNTIMIVDASPERAVVWTNPEDIKIDPKKPIDGLGGQHEKTFTAAYCDGSVRQIPLDVAMKTLRLLFDPKDGTPIPQF
ncbi:MAG: DUF1559 domain-containing protein [Planctomycetes bacterium]|nr:DUF1559 domain-containing protein [Planctomycetota bacterium]